MKNLTDEVYKKIVRLSDEVKKDLRSKGIIVPSKNDDGTISVGLYKIVKKLDGFYAIVDQWNDVIVDNINLPQTAIILANNLALGKFKDTNIINADKHYGYALFDEMLHQRAVEKSAKKSIEYFDVMLTKALIAKAKKERYKQDVVKSFEKLIRLV